MLKLDLTIPFILVTIHTSGWGIDLFRRKRKTCESKLFLVIEESPTFMAGSMSIILSFISTELVPIRESFLSDEIFTLFYGIPISFNFNDIDVSVGNITMSLSQTPSFWIILVIDTVNTFVSALLIPLWAILTTHLYLEKTEGKEIRGETRADVMEAQI